MRRMPGHKDKTRNARTWDQGLRPWGGDLGYKGNKACARDETRVPGLKGKARGYEYSLDSWPKAGKRSVKTFCKRPTLNRRENELTIF